MSWIDPFTKRRITTKRTVYHPGIEAHHMAARAATAVEAGMDEIALLPLEAWSRDVEASIAAMSVKVK